jgi:hypothetical protein
MTQNLYYSVQRLGVMLFGCCDNGERHVAEQGLIVSNQREVDFEALWHRGIGKPLRHAVSIGFVGDRLLDGGEVILTVRMLDVGQQLRPFARERHAAPEQVPRGAHRGGLDVRLGDHTAAEEHRNLVGIALIVFGFASMDGLHGEGMAVMPPAALAA